MKLRDLSNREIILIVSGISFLIIIVLLGLSFFAFTSPKYNGPIQDSIMGTLLAIMSLIIMLGVAFSFVSIFDAKEDIKSIESKVNRLHELFTRSNRHLEKEKKDLYNRISSSENKLQKEVDIKLKNNEERLDEMLVSNELATMDMSAASSYNSCRYLQAIMQELEVLDYIFSNYNRCRKKVTSYVGLKRGTISNDIKSFLYHTALNGFPIFDKGELDNIMQVTLGKIGNICKSKNFGAIEPNEIFRYDLLFKTVQRILIGLVKKDITFDVDYSTYRTFYIYSKLTIGSNPDSCVDISKEMEERLEKEYLAISSVRGETRLDAD